MGRLENIVARNRRPHGLRASIAMAWRGIVILVLLGLLIFTDWALTDEPESTPAAPAPALRGERRLEGVPLLRAPAARAARPAASAANPEGGAARERAP